MIEGVIRKCVGVVHHSTACPRARRVTVDHQRAILHDNCDWYGRTACKRSRTDCRPAYRKGCESIRRCYRKSAADSFQWRGRVTAVKKGGFIDRLIPWCAPTIGVRNHNRRTCITSENPYCQNCCTLVTVSIRYRVDKGFNQGTP